jgi:hypothetical protein
VTPFLQIRELQTDSGCITCQQEEIFRKRSGVSSRRTPLQVSVWRNLPKIVQLLRVRPAANCWRCVLARQTAEDKHDSKLAESCPTSGSSEISELPSVKDGKSNLKPVNKKRLRDLRPGDRVLVFDARLR